MAVISIQVLQEFYVGATRKFGIDPLAAKEMIAANLRRTPWERMVQHSRALETTRLLRAAMEKRDARS